MYIQIDDRIYKWLISLDVIKPEGRKQKKSATVELSLSTSLSMESGVLFAHLLKNLLKKTNNTTTPMAILDTLKEFSTPTSRLYNWNILTDAYQAINVEIKPDVKSLIVAGDRGIVVAFLKEIYTQIVSGAAGEKPNQEFEDFDELAFDSSNFVGKSFMMNENKKKGHESIDLNKINMDTPVDQTETLLEFFIICVGKHMNLNSKQTACLFTKNSKYLAHVVIKGLKGQYEPITTFLQEIYGNLDHVLTLLEADVTKSTLSFSLQALKPGLVSKSIEISQWSLRIFSKLSFEFLKRNLHIHCWDWFVGEHKGFLSFLWCLKRHPDLKAEILAILLQIGRFNFLEMLTSLLKKFQPNPKDFFYTITQLMKPMSESKLLREDLINSGVLEYWLEFAENITQEEFSISTDAKIEILSFFTQVWINYADKIEEKEEKALKIIDLLKKSCYDSKFSIKIISITHLFQLLEFFGNGKKLYSPLIYKTLTMILLENHGNLELRDYIIRNFMNIFEEFPNIPLTPIFEPLIKQIQISENSSYFLNIIDFSLFIFFAKTDSLGVKNAIQLLDFLAKLFLNELVFAQICSLPMVTIILKYKSNETMQEFIIKFVKICLAMLYASEKKKKINNPNNPINPNLNISQQKANALTEVEVINSQKRALIIEILRQICNIGNHSLLNKLKPLIAHTCLQIKEFSKKYHKGLVLILNMFGDAQSLLEKYEQEFIESLKEKEKTPENSNENIEKSSFKSPKSELFGKKTKNLPSLKTNNADPKALKAIEETKQNFQMKITGKIRLEEENIKAIEKSKNLLRKQLEIRNIQQNIGNFGQKDMEVNLLFEENAPKPKELTQIANENIEIIDLKLEEERDLLLIDDFNRKNHKTFKYLFLKYSNSGYWTKQETFDKISDAKSQKISVSELFKLFKDHGYESLINQDKVSNVIKALSLQMTDNKSSFITLDYELFQNFFMQMAFLIHSKEFLGGTINLSMEKMLNAFREEEKKQGLNVKIYDDPHCNFIYEKDVVDEINKNLQKDPDYVIPEGFKKYHEKKVTFDYCFPNSLELTKSYQISYLLLNDVINESLGINLIEPFATFTTTTLAKPKLNHVESTPCKLYETRKYLSPVEQHLKTISDRKNYKPVEEPTKEKHRVLEITRKRALSFEMKLLIANSDLKYKYITEECAYVLEDIIDAVENGKNTIDYIGKKQNKALQSKKELEKIIEEEQEEKEKLRRVRHEQIKKELKEKGSNVSKNFYLKEEDRKYKEENVRSKKVWNVRLKENEDMKKKVKEYRKSKSEEREEKKKEDEERFNEVKRKKEKQFEEFNKKAKEKLKDKFTKALEDRESEKKAQEDRQKQDKLKWKEYNEKVLPKKFEQETKMHKLEQGVNNKIISLVQNPKLSLIFEKYNNLLKILFDFVLKRTFIPLNYTGIPTISLEALSRFSKDFNICPTIFSLHEILLIYKSLTKLKAPAMIKDTVSNGLEYNEFLESLVRISIKGQKVFNQIGEKIKESGNIVQKDLKNIIEKEEKRTNSNKKIEELGDFKGEKAILERYKNVFDEYEEIDKTTVITLEGMLYYLGMPLDPNDKGFLEKRLKEIRVNKTLPNKYKKKDLERKLEDGIRYESPKKARTNGNPKKINKKPEKTEKEKIPEKTEKEKIPAVQMKEEEEEHDEEKSEKIEEIDHEILEKEKVDENENDVKREPSDQEEESP